MSLSDSLPGPACPSRASGWSRNHQEGSPVLRCCPLVACHRPYSGRIRRYVVLRLLTAAFPFRAEGRLLRGPFSELARRSRKLWPTNSLNRLKRPFYTEGFRDFVTSTSASIASGWNDQLPGG